MLLVKYHLSMLRAALVWPALKEVIFRVAFAKCDSFSYVERTTLLEMISPWFLTKEGMKLAMSLEAGFIHLTKQCCVRTVSQMM